MNFTQNKYDARSSNELRQIKTCQGRSSGVNMFGDEIREGEIVSYRTRAEDYASFFRRADGETPEVHYKAQRYMSSDVNHSDKRSVSRRSAIEGGGYRSVSEIAKLTDSEIIEAIYDACAEMGLEASDDLMFRLYESIVTDSTSTIGEAISKASMSKEKPPALDRGAMFKVRGDFTTEQKVFLRDEYPELDLVFEGGRRHDHGVAALARNMDVFLLRKKVDTNMPCVEVGGNPITYLAKGITNVHSCCPKLGIKDAERLAKREDFVRKEKAKLSEYQRRLDNRDRNRSNVKEFCREEERLMARFEALEAFEENPWQFMCNLPAQLCDAVAPVGISVHSGYDIPMNDWPVIMMQHKMHTVYGSMLYSSDTLSKERGSFSSMGIEFEVDREKDVINFNFLNRMTPSYSHKFSEYKKYGQTQLIQYHRFTFAYRVLKYRKYSLDFEIMYLSQDHVDRFVEGALLPSAYKGMIKVSSIEVNENAHYLHGMNFKPCETYVSALAWKRLMDYCLSTGEGLTYDKVSSFVVSLTQSIIMNGVKLSEGSDITSDNIGTISVAAFVITVRMRLESEEYVSKFRNDVDSYRKIRSNPSMIGIFGSWLSKFRRTLFEEPLHSVKKTLRDTLKTEDLASYLDMFSYELIEWDETDANDQTFSENEAAEMIVQADKILSAYSFVDVKTTKLFPDEEYVMPSEKAILDVRDQIISEGRFELLGELHDIVKGYESSISARVIDSFRDQYKAQKQKEKDNDTSATPTLSDTKSTHESESESSLETEDISDDHIKSDEAEKILQKMVVGEDVEKDLERKPYDYTFKFCETDQIGQLSKNESFVENGMIEIEGYPHMKLLPSSTSHSREDWSKAMNEFAALSEEAEVKVLNNAFIHASSWVTWQEAETRRIPNISKEVFSKFCEQYEPNILIFEKKVCTSAKIDYKKMGLLPSCDTWMFGFDVTEPFVHGAQREKYLVKIRLVEEEGHTFMVLENAIDSDVRYIFVERNLSVVLGSRFMEAAQRCSPRNFHIPNRTIMMEMIAGAGKSYFVEWAAKEGDLVLTARKDAVGEFALKFMERGLTPEDIDVMTIDSYVINGIYKSPNRRFKRVHIDEATMAHFGELVLVCQKARPQELFLYGDRKQISYVVRDTIKKVMYKSVPDSFTRYYSLLSRRFPADACYLNKAFYGVDISTTNTRLRSFKVKKYTSVNDIPLIRDCHYICFTNLDVGELRSIFKRRKFQDFTIEKIPMLSREDDGSTVKMKEKKFQKVTTAHVAEGGTWKHVVIFRPQKKTYPIYSEEPHLLVATTRHTQTCTYVSADTNDTLWRHMARAIDAPDTILETHTVVDQKKDVFSESDEDEIVYNKSMESHPVLTGVFEK